MPKIIAYTYDASAHCVDCAKKRTFKLSANSLNAPDEGAYDEHGIPIHAMDGEGNALHPVFSTDEHLEGLDCGDCLCEIVAPSKSNTSPGD
jgi:hypothetical protein